MGNHQTSLDLSKHWTVPIEKHIPERIINFRVTNPVDGKPYSFSMKYTNPNGSLEDMRMGICTGHDDEAFFLWEPKDHARDFEVVDGVKYARGQIIGVVVDEDVGVMFKLAWNPSPKSDAMHLLSRPFQADIWKRDREMCTTVLSESLGLGNVCLLIQNGKCIVLDDKEAVSDTNCVYTPFVEPELNNFRDYAKRKAEESEEDQVSKRRKSSDSSEESSEESE